MFQQQTKWSRLLLVFFWIILFIILVIYLLKGINIVKNFYSYNLSWGFILKYLSSYIIFEKIFFFLFMGYISIRYFKMLLIEVIDSFIDYIHSSDLFSYLSSLLLILGGTSYIYFIYYIFI